MHQFITPLRDLQENCRSNHQPARVFSLATLILTTVLNSQLIQAAEHEWAVFFQSDTFGYSEPTAIYALANNFDGSFESGGNDAFIHTFVETGAHYGPFTISIFSRYDYYTEFTSDTALFAFQTENDLPITARDYDLDLEVNHIRAQGFRFGYTFSPIDTLTVGIFASYLQADYFLDGDVIADININATDDITGNSAVNYVYTEDVLFSRPVSEPDGKGYTIDLNIAWQATDKLALQLQLRDLINEISWDDAPFTRGVIDTSKSSVTEAGQLVVKPLLSAFESFKDHKQRLPLNATGNIDYQLNSDIQLSTSIHYANGVILPMLSLGYQLNTDTQIQFSFATKQRGVGLGVIWKDLHIFYLADDLDYEKAQIFNLNLYYQWVF
ncbi:MAG: hypothetical protein KUG79_15300 [Pseudomonadales bacterium]|nr:hypothetical protein [Pseudomonadales bacterium]